MAPEGKELTALVRVDGRIEISRGKAPPSPPPPSVTGGRTFAAMPHADHLFCSAIPARRSLGARSHSLSVAISRSRRPRRAAIATRARHHRALKPLANHRHACFDPRADLSRAGIANDLAVSRRNRSRFVGAALREVRSAEARVSSQSIARELVARRVHRGQRCFRCSCGNAFTRGPAPKVASGPRLRVEDSDRERRNVEHPRALRKDEIAPLSRHRERSFIAHDGHFASLDLHRSSDLSFEMRRRGRTHVAESRKRHTHHHQDRRFSAAASATRSEIAVESTDGPSGIAFTPSSSGADVNGDLSELSLEHREWSLRCVEAPRLAQSFRRCSVVHFATGKRHATNRNRCTISHRCKTRSGIRCGSTPRPRTRPTRRPGDLPLLHHRRVVEPPRDGHRLADECRSA